MLSVNIRTQAKSLLICILLAFAFVVINLLIISLAQQFVPYNTRGFPYGEMINQYRLPAQLKALTNFDGVQYSVIANEGKYFTYQQAYFPLYPWLMRLIAPLFLGNYPLAGLVISFVSFVGVLYLLNRIGHRIWVKSPSTTYLHPSVLLLLVLPCSFFFMAVYNESLFLLLTLLLINLLIERKFYLLFIITLLASLTRLVGIFLIIPVLLAFLTSKKQTERIFLSFAILGSIIGLAIYMLYLLQTTGDPLAFLHSQTAFNSSRSTSIVLLPQVIYRYIKIFFTAKFDPNYFVALVEFVITTFYLTIISWHLFRYRLTIVNLFRPHIPRVDDSWLTIGLLLFSLANIILPTLTGTLSSLPRYSLLSIAILPLILRAKKATQLVFIGVSFALHVVLLALFAMGWFVS